MDDCYKFATTSLESKGRLEEMIIGRIRVKEEVIEVKNEGDAEEPVLVDCKVLIEEGIWNDEDPLQTDGSETMDVERVFDKKFSCRVCRKKFRFYSTLKRHFAKHFKRSFICQCGKTFPTLLSMWSHQKTSGHKTYKVRNKNLLMLILHRNFFKFFNRSLRKHRTSKGQQTTALENLTRATFARKTSRRNIN